MLLRGKFILGINERGIYLQIKKLRIKNFQSVKDIELEFDSKGVYRFSGPNNIGKSVILKAISTVMLNVSNRYYKEFIRDEEDTFEIRIEGFEGNWVYLSRGAVDFYAWSIGGVEGREDRTGGKVPLDVKKYFNLYVEDEKTNECLNIRLPDDLLLYVNTTAGDNAMMFQRALGTEDYMVGIKKVDKKARELNKEIKLVDKYLIQEHEKLNDAAAELQQVTNSVEEIERYEDVLIAERDRYLEISHMVDETIDFMRLSKETRESAKALEELSLDSIEEGLKKLQDIVTVYDLYEEYAVTNKKLKAEKEALEESSSDGLDSEIDTLTKLEGALDDYKEVEALESKLSKTVALDVEQEKDTQASIKVLEAVEGAIEIATEVAKITKSVRTGTEKVAELEEQIKELEAELGYCPTCGSEFPHEH